MDPWKGRLDALGRVDSVTGGGDEEMMPDDSKSGNAAVAARTSDPLVEARNVEWNIREATGHEELDSILAGDPMDMFQWDEWESLASEFFVS